MSCLFHAYKFSCYEFDTDMQEYKRIDGRTGLKHKWKILLITMKSKPKCFEMFDVAPLLLFWACNSKKISFCLAEQKEIICEHVNIRCPETF